MIGFIIKLAILAAIILVTLNIFAPEKADEITSKISDETGIKKEVIDKRLDSATEFVQESTEAVKEIAKEKIEESTN